ncbi:MAG: hypothetical protein KJT01_14965 [Gemmatimonadetes bacterium]|nr:hypothetical protein [Gemmatimonadota bacterium]
MSSVPPHRDPGPAPASPAPPLEARLPLALLEAVRVIDTPENDWDLELLEELRTKRLGLSATVQQQIRRYADAVRVRQRVPAEEVAQLARLIGRRPDAEQAFREAGRRWAHGVVESTSPTRRRAARGLPGWLARPVALGLLRTIASRSLGGQLVRQGSALHFHLHAPAGVDAGAAPSPCLVYEAALREALREVAGMEGAVDHMQCRARGDAGCEWRAEWRRR